MLSYVVYYHRKPIKSNSDPKLRQDGPSQRKVSGTYLLMKDIGQDPHSVLNVKNLKLDPNLWAFIMTVFYYPAYQA